MYKTVVIVCNGDNYRESKIINACKDADYIISVDGGLGILDRLSIIPDLIIGDMDSVDKDLLKKYDKVELDIYPADKDFTDSELAIKKAITLNPVKIIIFSAIGNYIDHSFANLFNLLRNYSNAIDMRIVTDNSEIFPLLNEKIINNANGRRFSFFPFGDVKGLDLQGFMYTFNGESNLSRLEYSVSNVIIADSASIKIDEGMIICVLFDEGCK